MFPQPQGIPTNDIELAVYEKGNGEPVVFLHGFPELAFSWRFQLPVVAAAGYRAIAPDLRGYGGSDKPVGVEHYTLQKLMGDITGLLDELEVEAAHIVAHDWGALLAWQLALHSPDDVIISPEQIEAMRPFVNDLKIEMLENCGHWSQQEQPDAVNTLLLHWLAERSPAGA